VNSTNDATKANFFSNLEPDPEHLGCIKHKRANKDKYYALKVNGKKVEAHRFVYLVTKGDIPAGFDVHHACENKRCVNIEHLECLPHKKHTKHHTATQFKKGTARTETYRRCIAREDTGTIWNSSAGMELLKEETVLFVVREISRSYSDQLLILLRVE
jgi:hypothetical protein